MSSSSPGRTAVLAALALLLAACGGRPPAQDRGGTVPAGSTGAGPGGMMGRGGTVGRAGTTGAMMGGTTGGTMGRAGMTGGMMGRAGMTGGMMGARADTAAAPRAQAAAATAPDCPPIAQPLVDQGRAIFTGGGNCFACHGSNAKGTALAPDLTDQTWLNIDGSYAAIADLVRTGVAKPKQHPAPMPPLGGAQLDQAQVCAVAAYVYSLGHKGG